MNEQSLLPIEWDKWLNHNLSRGCKILELTEILYKHGFTREQTRASIRYPNSTKPEQAIQDDIVDFSISQDEVEFNNQPFRAQATQYPDDRLELFEVNSFLSYEECLSLIKLAKSSHQPSTTTTGEIGFRTSHTCHLNSVSNQLVQNLDQKICDFMGIPAVQSEPIQAQIYYPGAQFKAHTDYFNRDSDIERSIGWQRSWTFMLVLQASDLGGATYFEHLDTRFKPSAGDSLIWNNLDSFGQPNTWTLHEGEKVIQGCKIILTKWFKAQL